MPTFSLQFSEPEPESDDEVAPKSRGAVGSGVEVEKRAARTASSSSGEEEEEANAADSGAAAKGK